MNRRRRNTTKIVTPKAVVNAVMADLRAEGQSALIRWLSNEDHRFVMEQYAQGLLPSAAPEPEPEPEPVAAPSGSLPISHEYREILFETVKKGKKALGLTAFRKKGDMARFLRGTNMGTQVLQIGGDEYGFWSLYARDLPRSKQGMRPLTGDLKTDAQNIFKLIASTNQQTLPRVDSFLAAAQKPKKTTAAKPSEAHPYAGHQADPNAVRRVGGEIVDWIEPLYPHVSPETAYVQDDYPQGRGDKRGERRTWVEFKPKKGFRFVYQTEDLYRGGWNKPKPDTYNFLANVMYLDKRNDHVENWTLGAYNAEANQIMAFLDAFPDISPMQRAILDQWAFAKERYTSGVVEQNKKGFTGMSINGQPVPAREGDLERNTATLEAWREVRKRLESMQTRSNRRGRRRSNPLRKVVYSGG